MESKINSIITTTIFTLSVLWYNNASATDKTETVKGTITLGSTGYGIKLDNGKVIGFMGRGGNKVFITCHNGDTCEITGVVVYNIKKPIFLTVTSVRKLAAPSKAMTGNTPTKAAKSQGPTTPTDESDNASPFLLDNNTPAQTPAPTDKTAPVAAPSPPASNAKQETIPEPASDKSAQPETPAAHTDEPDNSSPFLLDNNPSQ